MNEPAPTALSQAVLTFCASYAVFGALGAAGAERLLRCYPMTRREAARFKMIWLLWFASISYLVSHFLIAALYP